MYTSLDVDERIKLFSLPGKRPGNKIMSQMKVLLQQIGIDRYDRLLF